MSSILKALKQLERDHADADPASQPLVEPADGTDPPPPAALRRRRQRWIRGGAAVAAVSAAVLGGALIGSVLDAPPPDGVALGEAASPAAEGVDSSPPASRGGAAPAGGSVPERAERVASPPPPAAVELVRAEPAEPAELREPSRSAPGPKREPVAWSDLQRPAPAPDPVAPAPEAPSESLSRLVSPVRAVGANSKGVAKPPALEPDRVKTPLPGLDSTRWHPTPERRAAQVRVAGRRRSVSQGEVVSGYRVLDITPSAIVFEREGESFRVRVGDR